jgi:hypothetical protein
MFMLVVSTLRRVPSSVCVLPAVPLTHDEVCTFLAKLGGSRPTQVLSSPRYPGVYSYILNIFIIVGVAGPVSRSYRDGGKLLTRVGYRPADIITTALPKSLYPSRNGLTSSIRPSDTRTYPG